MADLLTSWHLVVKPLATARADRNWRRDGEVLRSIWNTGRFVQDNMPFMARLFENEFNMAESIWFWLPNVRRMIDRLFDEACRGVYGKWQWRNFHMEDWEREKYSHIVLRAYVVGGGEHPWFD